MINLVFENVKIIGCRKGVYNEVPYFRVIVLLGNGISAPVSCTEEIFNNVSKKLESSQVVTAEKLSGSLSYFDSNFKVKFI